jgi:divalent metal cation (Fe/Co/Zn/Cd) transporter
VCGTEIGRHVVALGLLAAGGIHVLVASGSRDATLGWVSMVEWLLAGLALLGAFAYARGWWLGRPIAAVFTIATVGMLLVGIGIFSRSFEELGDRSPTPSAVQP